MIWYQKDNHKSEYIGPNAVLEAYCNYIANTLELPPSCNESYIHMYNILLPGWGHAQAVSQRQYCTLQAGAMSNTRQ